MNCEIGVAATRHESAVTVLEDMFILARQTPTYASVLYELLMTASHDMDGKVRIIVNDEYEKEISKTTGSKSVKVIKDALEFFEASGYFTQPQSGIFYVSDFLLDGITWRNADNIEVFIGKDEYGARKISLVTKELIPECPSTDSPTDKAGEGDYALQKKVSKTRKKRTKKEEESTEEADDNKFRQDKCDVTEITNPSSDTEHSPSPNIGASLNPLPLNDSATEKILTPVEAVECTTKKTLKRLMDGTESLEVADQPPEPASSSEDEECGTPPEEVFSNEIKHCFEQGAVEEDQECGLPPAEILSNEIMYCFEQEAEEQDQEYGMPPEELCSNEIMYCFDQEAEDQEFSPPFWQDANGNLTPEYGDPSTPTELCSSEVQVFRDKIHNSEHFEECIGSTPD